MMKSKFLLLGFLFAGLMMVNFSVYQCNGQTPQNIPVKKQTIKYTCPMHSEIVKNKPGNCPICGMTLVEKKDNSKKDMHQANDSTMMINDTMKMMHDTTMMKKGHMMQDPTMMNKGRMIQDTTMMKHN
jgi:membrane fusion protein, copper/silver efflux system